MIEIENVYKLFIQGNSEQKVLKNINLKVEKNDFITIMGPSGGGKSTLLYTLALLLEPTSGNILFNNKIVHFKNDKEIEKLRRKNIGLIFQNNNLISCLTALENIIIAIDSKETYKEKKKKAEYFLRRVDLYEKRNVISTALSGGEAQRVAVVRALINNPKIIFCDEPTGALDSANGKKVISLLLNLRKEIGSALVIVTHDEQIGSLGEKRFLLKDGVINEVV
ncbi:TPA: ABC transporter ATP-binding protein [Clostridium botulinum]|uniref:ABC transporter ATP-binding protein n=1 Tax=Clostridium botulinum TaxID=1491 RepID=UPI0004B94868|nr:ATP-binding cassette domain-containing protein [Clostridium botulinum]APC81505.1 ABC transporter family protein [Clostridium botulinum]APR02050.1 ABC transporter family protein [Clostridium botulinum]APU59846.1 ABC transporter family protein [Clostridium botulinum]MBN3398644.1 macrolide ABC transporter ATP-binding protein [Clostridium botulinum]MBN3413409.1 macrolide ABC transporter ATP-binding protein [Clostridium botulinum]